MMQCLTDIPSSIKRVFLRSSLPESIYFYTFHKCASTLFSKYILRNMKGLKHVDYANQIYHGELKSSKELLFEKRGYAYGPMRLSADPKATVYNTLILPVSESEFIRDKIAIFFIRDPRDVLVSEFYSFGYSHNLSGVKEIREQQENVRSDIQSKSLDEYVLDSADITARNFKALHKLAGECERSVVLKYEDMVNNFDSFIAELCTYTVLEESVIREIYQRSRPKQREDVLSHRRSGKVEGFRGKLDNATIDALNSRLEEALTLSGYEI